MKNSIITDKSDIQTSKSAKNFFSPFAFGLFPMGAMFRAPGAPPMPLGPYGPPNRPMDIYAPGMYSPMGGGWSGMYRHPMGGYAPFRPMYMPRGPYGRGPRGPYGPGSYPPISNGLRGSYGPGSYPPISNGIRGSYGPGSYPPMSNGIRGSYGPGSYPPMSNGLNVPYRPW